MRHTSLMGMIDLLDSLNSAAWKKIPNWPPYNVKKTDDNHYVIEMAVAGFGQSDLDITLEKDTLVVKGALTSDPKVEYIHKGIAERAFEMAFPLPESVVVKNASLVNGMLKVWLEQFIPEEKKPKKIAIDPGLNTLAQEKLPAA